MTGKPLFLDTSIIVDHLMLGESKPTQREAITTLLSQFDYLSACSFSRLEYKRVVIQNLGLVLDYLCEEGSFLRALQRATRLRQDRRVKTLINLAAWVGAQVKRDLEIRPGDDADAQLALRAESYIRVGLLSLWRRFDRAVSSVFDQTQCNRARESPHRKRNGSFDVAIPKKECANRKCNNGNFFRSQLPKIRTLCATLRQRKTKDHLTEELERILDAAEAACRNADRLYNYSNCLELGDLWIHLECTVAGIKDLATTNYKESEVLCPAFGLNMKAVPG